MFQVEPKACEGLEAERKKKNQKQTHIQRTKRIEWQEYRELGEAWHRGQQRSDRV